LRAAANRDAEPVRALKILVAVMGVMILAGFGALIIIIVGRVSHPRRAAPLPGHAAAAIELPAGARIESMGLGADRLALAIELPDGSQQIVIVDLASGRRLNTIALHRAP
jgi:Family of unknown function (DUF6476)